MIDDFDVGASVPLLDIVPTSQAEKLQWFKVSEASTEDEAVEIAKYAWTSPYDQEKGPMTRLQVHLQTLQRLCIHHDRHRSCTILYLQDVNGIAQ